VRGRRWCAVCIPGVVNAGEICCPKLSMASGFDGADGPVSTTVPSTGEGDDPRPNIEAKRSSSVRSGRCIRLFLD